MWVAASAAGRLLCRPYHGGSLPFGQDVTGRATASAFSNALRRPRLFLVPISSLLPYSASTNTGWWRIRTKELQGTKRWLQVLSRNPPRRSIRGAHNWDRSRAQAVWFSSDMDSPAFSLWGLWNLYSLRISARTLSRRFLGGGGGGTGCLAEGVQTLLPRYNGPFGGDTVSFSTFARDGFHSRLTSSITFVTSFSHQRISFLCCGRPGYLNVVCTNSILGWPFPQNSSSDHVSPDSVYGITILQAYTYFRNNGQGSTRMRSFISEPPPPAENLARHWRYRSRSCCACLHKRALHTFRPPVASSTPRRWS